MKSKLEYREHLKARGYCIGKIEEGFSKVEPHPREFFFEKLPVDIPTEKEKDRVFALVCDYNPGLPNVSRILGKHKHILQLDDELTSVIKPESIVASYRGVNTIGDALIHSKLPKLVDEVSEDSVGEIVEDNAGACHKCVKGCILCKNYLRPCKSFSSYHTNREFPIIDDLDCNTTGVIYLINDHICKRSSVGCTTNSAKTRFGIHKSHIKSSLKTCILSKHFTENVQWHELDRSSFANYDKCLKMQLDIIVIEKVIIPDDVTETYAKLRICEVRERHWQHKLRPLEEYGGLNVREERKPC